eukprot:400597_1
MNKSEFNEVVIKKLNTMLQTSDLCTLTKKQIREQLHNEFQDIDFTEKKWKKLISQQIEEHINKTQSSDSSDDDLIIPKKSLKKRKLNNNESKNTKECSIDNDHHDNHRKTPTKNSLFTKESDNNYFMVLPNESSTEKRCVLSKYRGKLYIGFREYYQKNNQKLPSKKGINLTPQQWKFIVEHIDDIDQQYKQMT